MAAQTQVRKILIKVDTAGAPQLNDLAAKLGGVNKNTRDMAKSMNFLSSGMTAFLGGLSVRELAGFSDQIQNLNNRLLSMTGNQTEATEVMMRLVQIARDTNSSLDGIGQSYFRMAQALRDANISQSTLLDMTKTIANTFRLSGASTDEATNATIQLGQAFSLGALRGQDLRSVMSQNVVLTRLLRKEFGNNLLKEAEKGLITVPRLMEVLRKNMSSVDEQAKMMSATFDQSLTKALDALKLKVFEVSDALGLQGKFATGMNLSVENMGAVVSVGSILAFATLPAMAGAFVRLAGAVGLLNPITAGAVVGLTAVVALFGDSWDISKLIKQMEIGFTELKAIINDGISSIDLFLGSLKIFSSATRDSFTVAGLQAADAAKDHRTHAQALRLESAAQEEYDKMLRKTGGTANNWSKDIANATKAFQHDLEAKQQLAALNKLYSSGAIDVAEYNKRILDTAASMSKWKFKEGEEDLGKLQDAIRKTEVFRLNQDFKDGVINVDQFRSALSGLRIDSLKEDLEAGRISLEEFNLKLASVSDKFSAGGAFRTGIQEYIQSIGTSTQQVADLVKDTFTKLEDVFMGFIKNGKFEFEKFAQSILDDLTRIILRASIIKPLADGLLSVLPSVGATATAGGAPSGAYSQYPMPVQAKGGVWDSGIQMFAKGGVVNSPTMFGHRGGLGLMGESGPEAIIPLQRGSGGNLGVAATVTPVHINIVNQSGGEVEQRETTGPNGERTIEILIHGKVKEGIIGGKFDKVMQQAYGLNRKGS